MQKIWILRESDIGAESVLSEAGIPPIAAKVLAARGIKSVSEAQSFLDTSTSLIGNPNMIPDMGNACERIKKALDEGERIAVFGDYDVDGITATGLVVSWLCAKGADCIYYIPDRMEEGYGLSIGALQQLAKKNVSLIITVDLGTSAIAEAKWAKLHGIDLIITDHHKCRDELPEACAVINPRRSDSEYEFKYLSGVGVAFMLVLEYEGIENVEALLTEYSDLVAIGTVSDMMPMVKTNRALVYRGVQEINRGNRVGLKALVRESVQENTEVNTGALGYSIAPRINAAGRIGCADCAVELFLTEDAQKAQELAEQLCKFNRMRQKTENDTYKEAVERCEEHIRSLGDGSKSTGAIVISDENWHPGVIGIIASRLSERYARPVFLISLNNGIGKGSARSFYGINILNALQKASYLFDTWGGHEFAAGFTIREENIPALRELLENISCELESPHIHIDATLESSLLTEQAIFGLSILEPFGAHNSTPVFLIYNVELKEIIPLGWGNSLKLRVVKDGVSYSAFYFGTTKDRLDLCEGDIGDAVCKLEADKSNGEMSLRIILLDIRLEAGACKKFHSEMELFNRLKTGKDISGEEAATLMPNKPEFVAVLRHIHRNSDSDGNMKALLGSMCRAISREEDIELSYARFMVCLEALSEKNRLRYTLTDDIIEIRLLEDHPTNLNTSKTMIKIRELIEQ